MNRIFALITSICLCALLLCGCGGGDSGKTPISSSVTQTDTVQLGASAEEKVVPESSDYSSILCNTLWYCESGDAAWTFVSDGTYTKEKVTTTYSGSWTLSDSGDVVTLSMTDSADGTTKEYQLTFHDDNTIDLLSTNGKLYRLLPFGT